MNVNLNGSPFQLEGEASLLTLLETKGLKPDRIVVEYNYSIVNKEQWANITIKENDNIEVLSFVGGG
jgi:sulfur carrier protein